MLVARDGNGEKKEGQQLFSALPFTRYATLCHQRSCFSLHETVDVWELSLVETDFVKVAEFVFIDIIH